MSLSVFTEDHSAYQFYPVASNQLNLRVKASQDAHVMLTNHPYEGPPCYEIFFGCFNNTRTILRKNAQEPNLVEASTPGILSQYDHKSLWIRWEMGTISAGVGYEHTPTVSYHDDHLFSVLYFGVRTGWGSTGQWLIDQQTASSHPTYPHSESQPPINPFYPPPSSFPPAPPPVAMRWVTCSDGSLPGGAVVGGHDINGESLYVARAFHQGALIPGKFALSHKVAYIAWGGNEISKHVYEILCDCIPRWMTTAGDSLPHGALICGNTENGESLYAGRAYHEGSLVTGKVAGMVGRADVLACLFFILSFLTYHDSRWHCKRRVLLSCVFAAAGLLAKETGISVLMVNLLYDFYMSWAYLKKAFLEMRWNEESTLFCKRMATLSSVIIILIAVRLALLQGTLPKFSNQDNPAAFHPAPSVRFLTYGYLAAFNFWLLLFPFPLSHDWQMGSIPLVTNVLDQRNAFTCLFFVLCCWAAYKILKDFEHHRHVPLVLGLLFLVFPFIPASNLFVTVGFVVAERLLYIPSMGLILLVVYGGQLLSQKLAICFQRSWPVTLCIYLLLLAYTSRTVQRNKDWLNRASLIRSGLAAVPNNAKMHYNWANYLRESGQRELSMQHYKEALRLWPSYASAHNNLGTLMTSAKDAEALFLAAIRITPNHVNAHFNLGQVYKRMNKTDKAVSMLKKCLHLNPNYISAYLLLAKLYNGQIAGKLLKHATRLQPSDPNYYVYYAQWLHKKHRLTEAIHNYKKALYLCPTHKSSLIGLAHAYRDIGYTSRCHQVIIRWHAYCRQQHSSDIGKFVYTGDLYIRGWDMYKQGQRTLSRDHTVISQRESIIKCNAPSEESDQRSKHPIIVMIAFDGFRQDYVKGNILEKFKSESSCVPFLRNVFPTQTFPNFYSISTGMYPETHGVLSDEVFDPSHTECMPHSKPEMYYFNQASVTPIWVLNEIGGDGRHSGVMMWPASNYSFQNHLSTFVVQLDTGMAWEKRIDTAVEWLTNTTTPANLILMYFEEPETTAHEYGPKSEEVDKQLVRVNSIMLYYIRQLRYRGILDDVNTILLSDHGMTPVKQDAILNLNNYIDSASYSLCGHSPILQIQPKLGSEVTVYEKLAQGANESGGFEVFKRKDIPKIWHFKENPRCPDILVVCTSGHVFTDRKDLRGQNGYEFSHSMHGFFMARGPLFKSGYLLDTDPGIRNVDIYPLIAKVLNLEPPTRPNGSLDFIQNLLVNQENEAEEINLF